MDKPLYLDVVPAAARLLHTSVYSIRWGDMDAFGHVNNAMYFTYFEQARIDWLDSINHKHGLVLANVSCTFKRPVVYPASLEVRLYAGDAGHSSLDTFYQLGSAEKPGEICAIGHGTIIWYDHVRGCSVAIPDDVRRVITRACSNAPT